MAFQELHENDLQPQRDFFLNMLRTMGDVFWIFDVRSDRYLEISGRVREMTGWEPEAFVEEPGLWNRLVAEGEKRTRFLEGVVSEERETLEYELVDAHGRCRRVRDRVGRWRSPNGGEWLVGISDDVSREASAWWELDLMREVVTQVEEAILVTDADLDAPGGPRILYVNPAFTRMTGYSREEVIGRTPKILQGPGTDPEVLRELKTELRLGREFSAEALNYRKDGTSYMVGWSITPVRDRDGEIRHFASIQRDVTVERELRDMERRDQRLACLGNLAGGIAHDLNNILSPILLGAGLLPGADTEEQRVALSDSLSRSATRGQDVVGKLLAFARGGEKEKTPMRTTPILEEVYKISEETFPRNVELSLQTEPDLPTVKAAESDLQQVLLNLAINARDSLPDGGRIEFRASRRCLTRAESRDRGGEEGGDFVCLQVQDNGAGIPNAILDRVFDPFFTTKNPGEGTGLGLSSALGIVKDHGGFIQVRSREGEGACFSVYLPVCGEGEPLQEETSSSSYAKGRGETILVVDDEPAITGMTCRMLEVQGYRTHGITESTEALKFFRASPGGIDAVITDLMMPGLNGMEFVEEIRRLSPHLPVLVMTGYMDREMHDRAKALGVATVLEKPVKLANLMEETRRMLAG